MRYQFRLAERLKMTRRELTERMSLRELYMWASFDELDAADRKQAQQTADAKARLRR